MKWRNIILFVTLAVFACGCRWIDEDMRNCETDYTINYELNLVTNLNIELNTQLNLATDAEVKSAFQKYYNNIFTDKAHDVDLSFYDVNEPPERLHYEHHIIDASRSSYTLYLPVREYMHVAVANIEGNGSVTIEDDKLSTSTKLKQQEKDIVPSHKSGLFTARLPMEVKEGVDQKFKVNLYMANCATGIVLDTVGSKIKDVKVYTSGFATGMNLTDSTFRFTFDPRIEADKVEPEGRAGLPLCYATVNFPSKDVEKSKLTVDSDDQTVSEVSPESLWFYYIYAKLPNGSITETKLGVKLPLRAGQLKVIKATLTADGSVQPLAPYVGASVSLNWSDGPSWDIDF